MKKFLIIILSILMCFSMFAITGCGSSGGSSRGDGKTSCKNCGRNSVYALNFCKRCYDSFMDYTYGDWAYLINFNIKYI